MTFSIEQLSFNCTSSADTLVKDPNDDFKREAIFKRQALETVVMARKLIIAAKVPFTAPPGYFCELLKTKEQMSKITKKQEDEKKSQKAALDARKQRLNKKYGKKMQVERETEKAAVKREEIGKINKLRKRKKADHEEDDFDIEVEQDLSWEKSGKTNKKNGKAISAKRQSRNEKYGSGGKKRGIKRNDRESVDKDEFDVVRNKRAFKGTVFKKNPKYGQRGGSSSRGGRKSKGGRK